MLEIILIPNKRELRETIQFVIVLNRKISYDRESLKKPRQNSNFVEDIKLKKISFESQTRTKKVPNMINDKGKKGSTLK